MGVLEVGNANGAVCGEVVGTTANTGTCVAGAGTGELAIGGRVGATLGIRVGEIGSLDGELENDGDADGTNAASGALELVMLGICVGEKDPTGTGAAESLVGNDDNGARVVGASEIGVLEDGVCDTGAFVRASVGFAVGIGAFEIGAVKVGAIVKGATEGAFTIVGSFDVGTPVVRGSNTVGASVSGN